MPIDYCDMLLLTSIFCYAVRLFVSQFPLFLSFHFINRLHSDIELRVQLLSKMDLDKEIAWVTENEDKLAKSMETVHSFRKSTAFIAWARRAGYQMPATATILSPIEELRHLAVGALVSGATVHTSPSSASITTTVEVMTMLKELMAKVDKCNALQTRVNDLEPAVPVQRV